MARTNQNIKNQRAYVKRIRNKGFNFNLIVADAFIRGIRDIGYKSTATALDELIDNSIQAEAQNVLLAYQYGDAANKPISLAIIDDGHGMDPDMIRMAMIWGGTHRENDRVGFGRYGYGLPSAAVSQGRRYAVYSIVEGGQWHKGELDLDLVAEGKYTKRNQIIVPPAEPTTLPDWLDRHINVYFGIEQFTQGTIIVLEELDRIDWKTDAGLDRNLSRHIGINYRNYVTQTKISVNGKMVRPIDPLFTTPNALHYDLDDERADALPDATIPIRGVDNQLWPMTVRFAYLPPTFARNDKAKPASKTNRNARFNVMNDHLGIIVCRNGRQIDVVSTLPNTKIVNDDRHWAVEIDFPAGLDEEFSITTSKQQIVISPRIWELLKQAGVFQAIRQLRRRFYEESRRQIAQTESKLEKRASEFAMEDSSKFQTMRPDADVQIIEQQAQRRLEEVATLRSEDTGRSIDEERVLLEQETEDAPFKVEYESLPGAPFYRMDQIGGQRRLVLNTDHRFFGRLYAGNEAGPRTRAALEVLLFAIGTAELESTGDRQLFYETERIEWSRRLNVALEQLANHIRMGKW